MNMIVRYLVLFAMILGLGACETMKDPEPEFSSTYPVSGEWWVRYTLDGEDYNDGYSKLTTSNTAANDGKAIWIDDYKNFWNFRVKCPVNMKTLSFSGSELISTAANSDGSAYDIAVNITQGKVIKNGGLSTSGVVTDSIYFEIEFEDEPGTIYEVSGVRRTGFLEDEH